jgi:hypothetical protein
MYGVPQAGLTLPAVAGPVERGVIRHWLSGGRSTLADAGFLDASVGNDALCLAWQ